MLGRALLVLLVVLNLGVAAWWALRAPASPPAPVPPRVGDAPLLELVAERPLATSTPRAAVACFRIGPFDDAQALEAARAEIAARVDFTATARSLASPPRGWRVVLPQLSRDQAQATVARIGAAGFSDFLVLPDSGVDANLIALGRYGSEVAARERAQALRARGFGAVAEPVGAGERLWLEFAAAQAFSDPAARPIACSGVVRGGRYTIDAPA